MALHRGRIDLLEEHLRRDPSLLHRTFTHDEIFPPELGCHDEVLATHGTPLKGATLLHMAVDYDELEIARWLIERGMDVDARAAVDAEGFGGHTPLFATVVSQPNFWMNLPAQTAGRAIHAAVARPRRRSKCSCLAPEAAPPRLRRGDDARVPGRHAVRLGRALSPADLRKRPAMKMIADRGGHV